MTTPQEQLARIIRAHRISYADGHGTAKCSCGHVYNALTDTRRAQHIAQAILDAGWVAPPEKPVFQGCVWAQHNGICVYCGQGQTARDVLDGPFPCPQRTAAGMNVGPLNMHQNCADCGLKMAGDRSTGNWFRHRDPGQKWEYVCRNGCPLPEELY